MTKISGETEIKGTGVKLKNLIPGNQAHNLYCLLPNGFAIQRGIAYKPTGTSNVDVEFPLPFIDMNYSVVITPQFFYHPTVSFTISDKYLYKFKAWFSVTEENYFEWIAVGRCF